MSEPDARKIDAEVAVKVMGWRPDREWPSELFWTQEREQKYNFRPSSDIADAMAVLEKFLTGKGVGEWVDIRMRKGRALVSIFKSGDDDEIGTAVADTLPMAICLAALRAVGAERKDCGVQQKEHTDHEEKNE